MTTLITKAARNLAHRDPRFREALKRASSVMSIDDGIGQALDGIALEITRFLKTEYPDTLTKFGAPHANENGVQSVECQIQPKGWLAFWVKAQERSPTVELMANYPGVQQLHAKVLFERSDSPSKVVRRVGNQMMREIDNWFLDVERS